MFALSPSLCIRDYLTIWYSADSSVPRQRLVLRSGFPDHLITQRARCWRAAPCALAIAILVMGAPPSALQGHGDGQQQVVMQLPLMRRERLRLQAQQHGAGCRLVAFRHVEQTGGSSVREWMLRLDRMGQARFYGQTTRCAPPLADRYAPAQTVP